MSVNLFDCLRVASACRSMLAHDMLCDLPLDCPTALPAVLSAEPKLLTARNAAKALSISERSLWALTNRGEIPAVKMGRSVRYDTQDLQRWIERNKSASGKSSAAA